MGITIKQQTGKKREWWKLKNKNPKDISGMHCHQSSKQKSHERKQYQIWKNQHLLRKYELNKKNHILISNVISSESLLWSKSSSQLSPYWIETEITDRSDTATGSVPEEMAPTHPSFSSKVWGPCFLSLVRYLSQSGWAISFHMVLYLLQDRPRESHIPAL